MSFSLMLSLLFTKKQMHFLIFLCFILYVNAIPMPQGRYSRSEAFNGWTGIPMPQGGYSRSDAFNERTGSATSEYGIPFYVETLTAKYYIRYSIDWYYWSKFRRQWS